jgi:hypothetical protein
MQWFLFMETPESLNFRDMNIVDGFLIFACKKSVDILLYSYYLL